MLYFMFREQTMRSANVKTKRSKGSSAAISTPKSIRRTDTREALNMRIRPEVRNLIDHAAELAGKNRTDFVLDAARQAAQNTVLDQAVVAISPKAYAAFVALLDAPPAPNERLRKSLQLQPVWG
jgi:uncharacterized protein (DUF1778 family)